MKFSHIGQIILLPSTPNITKYPYWSNILLVILNYLPLTLQAINIEKIKLLVGGWWWVVVVVVVATKFSVKHQGKVYHHPPSTIHKWPLSDLPRSTLCPSLSLSFTIPVCLRFSMIIYTHLPNKCQCCDDVNNYFEHFKCWAWKMVRLFSSLKTRS